MTDNEFKWIIDNRKMLYELLYVLYKKGIITDEEWQRIKATTEENNDNV